MKGNKCFFIGIILCLFVACTNRNQQFAKEMKALQSKEIKLPSKGLVLLQSTELHEVEMNEKALKLVIQILSAVRLVRLIRSICGIVLLIMQINLIIN